MILFLILLVDSKEILGILDGSSLGGDLFGTNGTVGHDERKKEDDT
jgi:hypothetical protein